MIWCIYKIWRYISSCIEIYSKSWFFQAIHTAVSHKGFKEWKGLLELRQTQMHKKSISSVSNGDSQNITWVWQYFLYVHMFILLMLMLVKDEIYRNVNLQYFFFWRFICEECLFIIFQKSYLTSMTPKIKYNVDDNDDEANDDSFWALHSCNQNYV